MDMDMDVDMGLSTLPPKAASLQGGQLLKDLLSVARFGTPTIVPADDPGSNGSGNGDEPAIQMQTMQLSERQDMLLRQACKVFQLASLTLDDIFNMVPQQNQLCLITTMLLAIQKPNSELAQMINQEVPWDPLTMFQRWIVRTRIADQETSGLDLGETKMHVAALEAKVDTVKEVYRFSNSFEVTIVPSAMILKLPSPVLKYLRTIPFNSGDEAEAYLSYGIFGEIMELITAALPKGSPATRKRDQETGRKIVQFVSKFCSAVEHMLCYNAAWEAGLLEPKAKDWDLVWSKYSHMLTSGIVAEITDRLPPSQDTDGLSRLLEKMDPMDVESFLWSKSKPALICALVTLALGAQAIQQGHYIRASQFFPTTARFMSQALEQQSAVDGPSAAFKVVDFQLRRYLAMSQLAMLVHEIEQRREKRIMDRVEAQARNMSSSSSSTTAASTWTTSETTVHAVENGPSDAAALKQEEQNRDEAMTMELCRLLNQYLNTFGVMESNLQLRCVALCVNAKKWDFLSTYCRTSVEKLDRKVHPEICQVYGVLVPLCVILGLGHGQGLDLKDIAAVSALDALLSSGIDSMHITRMAAVDMIQGLLINVSRPKPSPNRPSGGGGHNRRGNNNSLQHEGAETTGSGILEDLGHAMILKLFGLIRLRGVLDVFGALVAGAITSILPERQKLTLSEFGYYALFTTSMDSLSSWSNSQIKIIAILSDGEAGRAVDATLGARNRLTKLLIQVYERQVRFETDAVTRRIRVEAKERARHPLSFSRETPVLSSSAVLSTISGAAITRHCLCLADLYHIEGMSQQSLAAFLHACMIASKGFTEVMRLDKRIWAGFSHGVSGSLSPIPPLQGATGPVGTTATNIPGAIFIPAGDGSPQSTFPTLTSLSQGGQPGGNTVGLGLTPPRSPTLEAMDGVASTLTPTGTSTNGAAVSAGPAVTSVFATRAFENCMQLNELLAAATLQQFLPKVDYNQAFSAIRLAHERGLITFTRGSNSSNFNTVPGAPAGGPSMTPSIPRVQNSKSVFSPDLQRILLALLAEDESSSEFLSAGQYRRSSIIEPGTHHLHHGRSPAVPNSSAAALLASSSVLRPEFSRPVLNADQFLELTYDSSELELVSYLCKQAKDSEGMTRVQTRLGSHRMALEYRQPSRDQIRALAQQDFLILMWSKYARIV
ncbi:hypothetical protein BGZ83_002109 [Gryganskiella cystojenkinii]|nr:hypothetical protein BGZ83_002109 [Gryganskiella cystojenkinii]